MLGLIYFLLGDDVDLVVDDGPVKPVEKLLSSILLS